MSCSHCSCQKCTDERAYLERSFIKVVLSISTENRTSKQIHNNLDKEDKNDETVSQHDVIYAETASGRTFSVKFSNRNGHRDGALYRWFLYFAKKNLLAQIKMITNKKAIIVANMEEDLLDIIPGKY